MLTTATQLARLCVDAAMFRREAFETVQGDPRLALAALSVPFLAGASELLGEAWVLASRKAGRWQVLMSLTTTGSAYVVSVVTWSGAAYLLMGLGGLHAPSQLAVLGVIAIGYAPRLLSLLAVAPYYGETLDHALDAWSMACIGVGLWSLGGESPLIVAVAVLGWLASLAVRRSGGTIGRFALRRVRRLVSSGTPS